MVLVWILLVVLIVLAVRRFTASDAPGGQLQSASDDADIEQLVAAGRLIDAIKLHRTLHGTDLKTAKDAIDRIRAEQARGTPRSSA
jgi:ribosomal protein L7/L12